MTVEETLRAWLLANTAVAALVADRVTPAPAQHQNVTPFVTYQLITAPEGVELDGTPDLALNRVQLSCISDDWGGARTVLAACRAAALDPALRGMAAGDNVIDSVTVIDRRDMGVDEDTGFFRHDLDLEVVERLSS